MNTYVRTNVPVIILAILTPKIDKNHIGLVKRKKTQIAISSNVKSCEWVMGSAL